jgi:predicted acylesterase/phospholipase RssA
MKYLVLGPGAQGGFAMLGYLKKIERDLSDLEEISGASVGAIMGAFLAAGKTIDQMLDIFLSTDLTPMSKPDLNIFLKKFGFVDTGYIQEHMKNIIGPVTFRELKKKLYVSAMCVTTGRTEYFSRDTHPGMLVAEAVQMSCSIPVMMAAHEFQGRLYCDGGFLECAPAQPFLARLHRDVLCILIRVPKTEHVVTNFKEYLGALVKSYMGQARHEYDFPTVYIETTGFNLVDMNMTFENKLRLFMIGNKFPCVIQQDEPTVWSKDQRGGHESGGGCEIRNSSKVIEQ